ncbi:MAG: class I SAM-dependent methyltransferase [Acidobacteriota bacterium]
MPLLIHTMAELSSLIFPALEVANCKTVTEIGSEGGAMTAQLLKFVERRGGWMTSVDPSPSATSEALLRSTPFGVLCRDISLRALSTNPCSDVYIVDGDHNYFTVLQELLWIERLQKQERKPFFAILHDVGWPWAYRDLYYNPELIPEESRKPFSWNRGLTLDNPGTVAGGFRGCGIWACALEEGGPENGVLKAAEDFLAARTGSVRMAVVPGVFGLGVMYASDAAWSDTLQAQLAPYDRNPLLAKLERNRIENYLRVIELQDAQSQVQQQEEPIHAG